ncbi:MAG: GNAT family N-acetyltransferase [Spartobacteria bacterium]|nr:GNAT family N-acetyltransferase [Spartobacteria bacterium]
MSEIDVQTGYCAGRQELAHALTDALAGDPHFPEVMRRMLWSPSWADAAGIPHAFYPGKKWKYRTNVVGFEPCAVRLEEIDGTYLRVQTTTNWALDLQPYGNTEAYFAALSKKMRKQLRWLDNVYEREHITVAPVRTEKEILAFVELFRTQWPDSDWCGSLKRSFVRFFRALEEMGKNRGFLLRTRDGTDLAGIMGYMTEHAYNLDLLARRVGEMEKYSPGFYIAFWMVRYFLEEEHPAWIMMGPGEYEYKKRFLATPIPVYRYERKTWRNLPGLIRIKNRYRKEMRKQWRRDAV